MSQKLEWRPAGGVAALATKEGRRLQVMATCNLIEGTWMAVALEAREDADTLEGLFEEHAHATIAEGVSMHRAIEAAEGYVAAWLAGDKEAMERCKCREIAPEPPEAARPPTVRFVCDQGHVWYGDSGDERCEKCGYGAVRTGPAKLGPGQDNPIMLERIGQPVEYCEVCSRPYVGIPCHMKEPGTDSLEGFVPGYVADLDARDIPVTCPRCNKPCKDIWEGLPACAACGYAYPWNESRLPVHTLECDMGVDCTCGANDHVPADPLEALQHHALCSLTPCICKQLNESDRRAERATAGDTSA